MIKTKSGISYKATHIPHLDTAISYIGVRERGGNNRGSDVEKFLRSVNLLPGNPYCAAFVSYCLSAAKSLFPIRSGLARKFKTKQSIKALDVMRGWKTAPKGSIPVWEKMKSLSGHTGFVLEDWKGKIGKTVEANTPSGNKGDQRDGKGDASGVNPRTREIQALGHFKITSFTIVK